MLKGDRERGCALGRGDIADCETCAAWDCDLDSDMERSEVGVPSSTAELEGGCWPAVRVSIWVCCWRIMLRRRFCES